jgi:hypothetical protein
MRLLTIPAALRELLPTPPHSPSGTQQPHALASMFLIDVACQEPPRGVGMPRALRASATSGSRQPYSYIQR